MTDTIFGIAIGLSIGLVAGWVKGYGVGYMRCLWRYNRMYKTLMEVYGKGTNAD